MVTSNPPCIAGGPETLQDNEMQLLGITINLVHRVVICMSYHSALLLEKLHDHIWKHGHHKHKYFGWHAALLGSSTFAFDTIVVSLYPFYLLQ
jgi:hypothetical protein